MNKIIFVILAVALVLAAILLSTFMGIKGSPEAIFRIKSDENTILFGVTPWGDPRQVKEAYKPLLQYLSEKTGKKFQLLVMEDYEAANENMIEGNIDVFIISPVSYVKAKEREPGLQYISTIMREQNGRRFATFVGHIVALKSKYAGWKIDDFLKNPKKYNFGFVSRSSASGWAYPLAMMKKKGIDPFKSFKDVKIFENHPSMTDAIAAGVTDLGATWEYNLELARLKYGDIFEIVYSTQPIPGLSWAAAKKIEPQFVDKLRQIQAEINSSDKLKEKLLKETPDKGWQTIDDGFYDEVREVVKYVGEFK